MKNTKAGLTIVEDKDPLPSGWKFGQIYYMININRTNINKTAEVIDKLLERIEKLENALTKEETT